MVPTIHIPFITFQKHIREFNFNSREGRGVFCINTRGAVHALQSDQLFKFQKNKLLRSRLMLKVCKLDLDPNEESNSDQVGFHQSRSSDFYSSHCSWVSTLTDSEIKSFIRLLRKKSLCFFGEIVQQWWP